MAHRCSSKHLRPRGGPKHETTTVIDRTLSDTDVSSSPRPAHGKRPSTQRDSRPPWRPRLPVRVTYVRRCRIPHQPDPAVPTDGSAHPTAPSAPRLQPTALNHSRQPRPPRHPKTPIDRQLTPPRPDSPHPTAPRRQGQGRTPSTFATARTRSTTHEFTSPPRPGVSRSSLRPNLRRVSPPVPPQPPSPHPPRPPQSRTPQPRQPQTPQP